MQAKAAAKSGDARERAEAAIADLRQLRVSIGRTIADVGEQWQDAKTRVLAQLDELKSRADAARRK
jgi:hypothetical protein